jgi:glycosyltransferase involved in cell wall biosynthesis
MIVYPYLNKKIDSEKKILTDLMYDSHFLFVPTKADCSPIIFAEASAYGMPVISNNVGGVPEMVHHGINGVLFSPDPSPDKYGDAILKIFSDDIQYKHYVHNSRTLYDTDLNWDKWAEKVSEHLEEVQ